MCVSSFSINNFYKNNLINKVTKQSNESVANEAPDVCINITESYPFNENFWFLTVCLKCECENKHSKLNYVIVFQCNTYPASYDDIDPASTTFESSLKFTPSVFISISISVSLKLIRIKNCSSSSKVLV